MRVLSRRRGYGDLFEALWAASQELIDNLNKHYQDIIVRLATMLSVPRLAPSLAVSAHLTRRNGDAGCDEARAGGTTQETCTYGGGDAGTCWKR